MTTGQNYVGKASCANSNGSTEQTVKPLSPRLVDSKGQLQAVTITWPDYMAERHPPLLIPSNAFIDSSTNIEYVNDVREALRSWFCAWLPEEVRDPVHGPGLTQALVIYQDLDEFLSNLITHSVPNAIDLAKKGLH